ncbi:MAG: DUF6445 family protein [Pseudomonadota bacterium]
MASVPRGGADPVTIAVNPLAKIEILEIGDGRRCAIVDEFLADPASLVRYSQAHASEFRIRPHTYPGPGRVVGAPCMEQIQRFIRSQLSRHFPFHRSAIKLTAGLSMVTLRPEQLSNFQRICHIDPRHAQDRRTFAGLVYLFDNAALGGTAFYRWKRQAIAFEAMARELRDPQAAHRYLQANSAYYREAPRYMTQSNDIAELMEVVPAKWNRFVFYDGEYPHSGHITRPDLLTQDFSTGRLSLNLFASVRPTPADTAPHEGATPRGDARRLRFD